MIAFYEYLSEALGYFRGVPSGQRGGRVGYLRMVVLRRLGRRDFGLFQASFVGYHDLLGNLLHRNLANNTLCQLRVLMGGFEDWQGRKSARQGGLYSRGSWAVRWA